jgi:branched-chain amino acid transport system substrate-binding protein
MKQKGFYILLVLGLLLASCAPQATPTEAPAAQPPAAATEAPAMATEAPAAATEAPAQPACAQQVKIGIIGSMSGTTASLGDYMKKGVTLAVEQKNAEGGVQGCQIQLVVYDDEADPTKSVSLAQKVATEDNVMAVWATTNSSTALSDLPVFEQYKIPQLTNGTNVDITNQGSAYIFRATPAGPAFENSLIDYLVKTGGYTKYAIIADNTAYGKGESDYQIAALKASNLEALDVESYGADDKDFTGQLTKIIAANPEVLLLASSEVAGGLITKQARQLGFTGTIAGGVAMGSAKYLETAGDAANGVYFTAAYPGNDANAQTKAFAAAFKARWGQDPEFHNANTYDLTEVLLMAMENAHPMTPENVAAEMHKICNYQGLQGNICVQDNGETLTKGLVGVIKDGQLTYVDQ